MEFLSAAFFSDLRRRTAIKFVLAIRYETIVMESILSHGFCPRQQSFCRRGQTEKKNHLFQTSENLPIFSSVLPRRTFICRNIGVNVFILGIAVFDDRRHQIVFINRRDFEQNRLDVFAERVVFERLRSGQRFFFR